MTRVRTFSFVVAVAAFGCTSPSEPASALVSVSVTASPADLRVGERTDISIDIANISGRAIQVALGGCNSNFDIVGADGVVYSQAELEYCSLMFLGPLSLAAGETYHISAHTKGRVIPQGSQLAPALLSPGKYGIRAVVGVRAGSADFKSVDSPVAIVTYR